MENACGQDVACGHDVQHMVLCMVLLQVACLVETKTPKPIEGFGVLEHGKACGHDIENSWCDVLNCWCCCKWVSCMEVLQIAFIVGAEALKPLLGFRSSAHVCAMTRVSCRMSTLIAW